jgi:hypothetical protein
LRFRQIAPRALGNRWVDSELLQLGRRRSAGNCPMSANAYHPDQN